MENNEPKPQAWNYDSRQTSNAPELQKQQPVDWSSVGSAMSKDVSEQHAMKWYFSTPVVLGILVVSAFISNVLGVLLVLIFMSRIIMATIRSNPSPSKIGSIVGWSAVTILFIGLALVI